jgi:hypothetical protein
MREPEPTADHQPTVPLCQRCATNAKGFDVRVGTTGRYVATHYPVRAGRYCQECAGVIADDMNAQQRPRRQGLHGEVRQLVKDGKPVQPRKEEYGDWPGRTDQ